MWKLSASSYISTCVGYVVAADLRLAHAVASAFLSSDPTCQQQMHNVMPKYRCMLHVFEGTMPT